MFSNFIGFKFYDFGGFRALAVVDRAGDCKFKMDFYVGCHNPQAPPGFNSPRTIG